MHSHWLIHVQRPFRQSHLNAHTEWGLCTLRHGIQISMEAILACHPARSTEWLDCHPKSCELWRIRTGPIWPKNGWESRKDVLTCHIIFAFNIFNPLTADDVYRRHGEWRRTTDDVYRRHLTYRRFSPSVAHSASSRFLQPFGNYSLHVWVQVQCKAATAFPQSERKRVEARVGSCSRLRDARRPGQSRIDGHRKSASRRRQRRLVAYWCLWKWCRVEWKAK